MLNSTLFARLQTNTDGLTLREILGSLPTDPASVFAVLLLSGALVLVLWYGRPRPKGGKKP